ncbi:MAG TPA: DUF2059 domain-containing protein [Burkholderiales bacterium]|nr:DUF2059 domain-containing protein [Burkholderiales bacterium]
MFAGAVPVAALADDMTPEKRADIEQLLQTTGALSLGKQMGVSLVEQISQALKKARPDIPQRVLDALPEEVGAVFEANIPSFKDTMIPLYGKYFTGAEIKQMLQFYSTDLGQKTIKVMPALLKESMAAGQQWGESLTPMIDARIRARLKKEGIKI